MPVAAIYSAGIVGWRIFTGTALLIKRRFYFATPTLMLYVREIPGTNKVSTISPHHEE